MSKPVQQERVVVYMARAQYEKLRALLLLRKKGGKTVSAWVREEATKLTGKDW